MVRKILRLCVALSTVLVFGSCLGSDDDNEVEYSDDAALQSFTLGSSINRYYYVRSSSGNVDSLVSRTFSGATYAFSIDHQRGLVYNTDSLPYGTDLSHVLCTATAYNNGVVTIKNVGSDTLRYVTSTDSIDFSVPRELQVYSQSRTAMRRYTVVLAAHQVPTDTTLWQQRGQSTELGKLERMKAVSLDGNIIVLGLSQGHTLIYMSPESDGATWTQSAATLGPEASANAVVGLGRLYVLDGTQLKSSADGTTFTAVGSQPLSRLVAASTKRLYALDANQQLVESVDSGSTWTASPLDNPSQLLPLDNIGFTCYPSRTNTNTDVLMMTGTRSDSLTYTWTRVEDNSAEATTYPWNYVEDGDYRAHRLPALHNLTILPYGDGAIAFGGDGLNGSTAQAFSTVYYTLDSGINWRTDSNYTLPESWDSSHSVFAATVDSHDRLWLIAGESGQVWRGYIVNQ